VPEALPFPDFALLHPGYGSVNGTPGSTPRAPAPIRKAMPDLTLTTVTRTQGNNRALKDSTVKPRTCTLAFEEVDPLIRAFRQMVRELRYDVCEMALTTYVCAKAHGKRFTALPVFLVRAFHHGAIVVNAKAGVASPKDLEGSRVGVNRGYTVTTGVWARAILQDEYGVDLSKITWVLSGDEHVAEYEPPTNVVPIEAGKDMNEMLVSGELAAAINVSVDHPGVQPLIPNALEAGIDALRTRGLYPINHLVVVKDELLAAHPDLAADLFKAFAEAKRLYVDKLKTGAIENPTQSDEMHRRVMEITGDPLPYGIEPNRKVLDALVGHALTQRIISEPVTVEELFAEGTRDLVA
jgi:4,5-dihydroxyphthalate decarboxylase